MSNFAWKDPVESLGIIKWFSDENKYGVIEEVNTQQEIFLHFSNWIDSCPIESINDSKILVFEISYERHKISAKKCKFFDYSEEHFRLYDALITKYNNYLFYTNKQNNQINISTLFECNDLCIKTLNMLLEKFFENINDNDFIENLHRYKEPFYVNCSINDFIIRESLNRFQKSTNLDFKKDLIGSDLIDINTVDIDFIMNNFNINTDLIKKIIKHPNLFSYFEEIFIKIDDLDLKKKIVFLGIKNEYDGLIRHYDKYIVFLDINAFIELEKAQTNHTILIENILIKSVDQDIFKHLIMHFEQYNLDNFQIFFDFGIDRLSHLNEENQVFFLKKLFHLKALNKVVFKAEDLASFCSITILKSAFNNKNSLDFSTFLIIDLISKFNHENGFLATHELINSVLHFLQFNKTKKVKINKYFDECDGYGRETLNSKDEKIEKVSFITNKGSTSHYFKVSFPFNEEFIEDIEQIPGSKYNQEEKFWGVPLRSEQELMIFAKKNSFLIDLDDRRKFEHNKDLIKIVKNPKEKPIGYSFCCGQESQKLSNTGNKFWWCNQTPCFQMNIKEHDNWEEYTLFDFAKTLNLNLLEVTSDRHEYAIGLYTRFITLINRFNRLLERLYCLECGHVLYPLESSNFHAQSVTKFMCKNENCQSNDKEVYLNNCLNGQCNAIIDSRRSMKCTNGWYICEDCGSCCSHIAMERRSKNLSINGGKISGGIYEFIENKLGHLEKAEYFCHQCGQYMTEYSSTLYKCGDCNVIYDLSKYSHISKKQIHLSLRSEIYPKKNNEIKNKLKNILQIEKQKLIQNGRTKGQIFGILFNKNVQIDDEIYSLKELNDKDLVNEIFD